MSWICVQLTRVPRRVLQPAQRSERLWAAFAHKWQAVTVYMAGSNRGAEQTKIVHQLDTEDDATAELMAK